MSAPPCPNCGKPGPHFVPPSMGEAGFYHCQREEIVAAPAPPSPQHDTMSDRAKTLSENDVARIIEDARFFRSDPDRRREQFADLDRLKAHVAALSESRERAMEYIRHRDTCAECFHRTDFPLSGQIIDTLELCETGARLRAAAEKGEAR